MSFLIDSHILIWFATAPERLSESAMNVMLDVSKPKSISIVTAWELGIKVSLGKLDIGMGGANFVQLQSARNAFGILPVTLDHIRVAETLPLHHRDPFDRMLVAQCLADNLSLISADAAMDPYGVTRIW